MTCLSKEIILERLERTRPDFGMDGSKERYRYMQWMSDTNAIKELFEEQAKHKGTPLKEGHWIEHDWKEMREKGYYRCSICGTGYQRFVKGIRKSDVPYIDGQEYTLQNIDNYCPNCGAKMYDEKTT